jgi:hypothetical protein
MSLLANGRWSLDALARATGVTDRTTRRDLNALEEVYVPIVWVECEGERLFYIAAVACPVCHRGKAETETTPRLGRPAPGSAPHLTR